MATYVAAEDRYDRMRYNRCGRSGLVLPAVSLGFWHNFGGIDPLRAQPRDRAPGLRPRRHAFRPREQLRPALRVGRGDLRAAHARRPAPVPRRADRLDEGRLRHVARARTASGARASTCSRASTRASSRMGLDYVDIFYSHRPDPGTPLEETMGALDSAVRQGKALYAGISSYSAEQTREAAGDPARRSAPRSSSTSRRTRSSTAGSSPTSSTRSASSVSAASSSRRSPQGVLTDKYLDGIPEGSRASRDDSLSPESITEETIARVRALERIADGRGTVACADGARVDAPRPAGDLDARRREQRRAARAEPRYARAARLLAGRSWRRSTARARLEGGCVERSGRGRPIDMEYRRLGSSS